MDGARLCRHPDYSWFGVSRTLFAHEKPMPVFFRQVNHTIFYALTASARVRWICRGGERRFEVPEGGVHFAPADGEEHVRIPEVSRRHHYHMMLIPPRHLDDIVSSEGCEPPRYLQVMLGLHDPILTTCLERLSGSRRGEESFSPLAEAEASRRLVLRLAEVNGSRRPDWTCDFSVFDRRAMADLVDFIDEHLRLVPSLGDMAARVGLSPSHFAKKFRQSTGLSLHRFINRRRVSRSLRILKGSPDSLASIALDLGFFSQSHFTRIFSGLTGMTPAKYQKQFRRTVG